MGLLESTATGAAAGSIVPGWGTAIGAGIGLLGGLAGYFGSQAKARAMRRETAESIRRQELADRSKLGLATAAGAASGVEFDSGSLQGYLASMQEEMRKQREWQARAGRTNADNVSLAGGIGLFTDLGKTFTGLAASNNWWQGPEGGGP